MDGIILVNKPKDITSRDLVNKACSHFSMKKIGHTGTLDPFAQGLMILTLGKATKISSYIEAKDKTYIGEMTLGVTSDTLDNTGHILETKEVPLLSKDDINNVFKSFLGASKQVPPMYSAIKIDGEELYKKARRGEKVDRKMRDIYIDELKLLSLEDNKILFEVKCSKGTYVRSLVDDIGKKIGCGALLSMLIRTRVGPFHVKNAKSIEDITTKDIIPIVDALSFFPMTIINKEEEKKIRNGVKIYLNNQSEKLLLINEDKVALAIYEKRSDGYYYCLRGLF